MNDQNARPSFAPTPLDVMSTWMYAPPVKEGGRRPNFRVKVLQNVPRFVVKTNVENDKNNGRIDFNMDLSTFGSIMDHIERMANDRSVEGATFEYRDNFVAGQKLDRVTTIGQCMIQRDKDSEQLFIAILAKDRPKIRFFFGPSQFHRIVKTDGSEMPASEMGDIYARGFVRTFNEVVTNLIISDFNVDAKNVAKPPQMQQGGGQSGYKSQSSGPKNNDGFGGQDDVEIFDAAFG